MFKVGMIGLGAMGIGMATNLANAGFLTVIYNRTTEKAHSLAQKLNVQVALSPEELAAQVDVICLCVSRDEDVLDIINALTKTIRPNTIVIDMSTVSSHTAKQAAAILACHNVDFLDAPVSGGVEGANTGRLAMMVGGNSTVLETVRPVLNSMATRVVHIGETGTGQATKAVNQIMGAGINQAVTEALAFAKAQNLPMDKIIDVISGGASGNWFLQHRGLSMTEGSYPAGFKVALHHKDLEICERMGENVGVNLPLTTQTRLDYEQLMANGFGDCDISALYHLKVK
ncbi:MAG: NAD(P)-dependent oxidoreductase [Methylococcales bacterium]|nr:NAD(P)-dependent oxidoreductase [Methylococcales bacterium]MDD5754623.1 NAD(P)-dependent oxidoreductase [Methylococcales bacterium]